MTYLPFLGICVATHRAMPVDRDLGRLTVDVPSTYLAGAQELHRLQEARVRFLVEQ